jgi:hypothetical protein
LIPLKELLFEYDITFPPSYPYEEDPSQPGAYMFTRCPAWCDRILLSPAARALLDETDVEISKIYGIIGENVCMGDHKVSGNQNISSSDIITSPFFHSPVAASVSEGEHKGQSRYG